MNAIRLSDHFTVRRLLRFVAPSIVMMVFTSIYSVVDGLFVSNFAGKTPFAAVNLIMPFLMILGTVGFMFGTGGTAIVAHTYGGGDRQGANRYFSLFVYVTLGISVVLAALGFFFSPFSLLSFSLSLQIFLVVSLIFLFQDLQFFQFPPVSFSCPDRAASLNTPVRRLRSSSPCRAGTVGGPVSCGARGGSRSSGPGGTAPCGRSSPPCRRISGPSRLRYGSAAGPGS